MSPGHCMHCCLLWGINLSVIRNKLRERWAAGRTLQRTFTGTGRGRGGVGGGARPSEASEDVFPIWKSSEVIVS